jgi:hypothetical protein
MQFDLLLLALLSAFWPTLVVIDVIAFQTSKPEQILLGFLAGGLLTTVVVGSLVVFALEDTDVGSSSVGSNSTAVIDFVLAGLAFLCAYILAHRPVKPKKQEPSGKKGRAERTREAIEKGASLAFVGGILLNIVPGVFPLIALKDVAGAGYTHAQVVATLFVFYVIMFALVELPIVGYVFAENWTSGQVTKFNNWLNQNQRRVAVWVLNAGGVYLAARGVYALLT